MASGLVFVAPTVHSTACQPPSLASTMRLAVQVTSLNAANIGDSAAKIAARRWLDRVGGVAVGDLVGVAGGECSNR